MFYFKKFMKAVACIHVIYTCVSQLAERVPLLGLDRQLGATIAL
jgi:hypothetical protein